MKIIIAILTVYFFLNFSYSVYFDWNGLFWFSEIDQILSLVSSQEDLTAAPYHFFFSVLFSSLCILCMFNTWGFSNNVDMINSVCNKKESDTGEKVKKYVRIIKGLNFFTIGACAIAMVGFYIFTTLGVSTQIYKNVYLIMDTVITIIFFVFLCSDNLCEAAQKIAIESHINGVETNQFSSGQISPLNATSSDGNIIELHDLMRDWFLIRNTIMLVDWPGFLGAASFLCVGIIMSQQNINIWYQKGFISAGILITFAITQSAFYFLNRTRERDQMNPWFSPIDSKMFEGFGLYCNIKQ